MTSTSYIPLDGGPSPADLPNPAGLIPLQRTTVVPLRPMPGQSLTAAAVRITSERIRESHYSRASHGDMGWQNDAWEVFDLVGEQRFLSTTLANRMGQAKLFVGRLDPEDPTGEPIPLTKDDEAIDGVSAEDIMGVFSAFGDTPSGRSQIITRLGINLNVAGDGYIIGFPPGLISKARGDEDWESKDTSVEGISLDALQWRALSSREVKYGSDGDVTLTIAEGKVEAPADDVYMVKVWRMHPADAQMSESPVRSSLPVLRELVGYTMHAGAQIDSRLAGAGVLFVPLSAAQAVKADLGRKATEEGADATQVSDDPFTDSIIATMSKAIKDRASASALSPLVFTVPDDTIEKFRYMSFSTPLDAAINELRDGAIRRVALGEDAPPEVLLGTGGMNHWGAWLVREDVVNTHVEPPLAIVCDAVTEQYLHPVLRDMGLTDESVENLVIWYDVSGMIMRPNRSADAKDLHAAGVISDAALREACGFDEADAPLAEQVAAEESDEKALRQAAGMKALDLAVADPQLVINPGLPALAQQVYDVMSGNYLDDPDADLATPPAAPVPAAAPAPAQGPPAEEETTPLPIAASARRRRELAGVR
jgi:hypothetical protein